jgi:hypothetical protein
MTSGENCTEFSVQFPIYVCGLQKGELRTFVQIFLGKRESIHDGINNNICDANRPYRWSATNLWEEEISMDLLGFGFLIFLLLKEKVVLRFW